MTEYILNKIIDQVFADSVIKEEKNILELKENLTADDLKRRLSIILADFCCL